MNSRSIAIFASVALFSVAARAADPFHTPDSLVLKDGRTIHGLIIKNSADSILMQEESGERIYLKDAIVRICDEPDPAALFTGVISKGTLPSSRVIANDLRMNDRIKSLVEIPAATITVGPFRNVPYRSFRVNRDIELNIYGDPAAPAGIEVGIYGRGKNDEKLQEALRSYFAGFLTTRQEIATFYRIGLKEGKATADVMAFEVTPVTSPNSEGAWWISLYNTKTLSASRLSQAKYDALTKPLDEVVARNGSVIAKGWRKNDITKTDRAKFLYDKRKVQLRGFYRDKNGDFQLLTAKTP